MTSDHQSPPIPSNNNNSDVLNQEGLSNNNRMITDNGNGPSTCSCQRCISVQMRLLEMSERLGRIEGLLIKIANNALRPSIYSSISHPSSPSSMSLSPIKVCANILTIEK